MLNFIIINGNISKIDKTPATLVSDFFDENYFLEVAYNSGAYDSPKLYSKSLFLHSKFNLEI